MIDSESIFDQVEEPPLVPAGCVLFVNGRRIDCRVVEETRLEQEGTRYTLFFEHPVRVLYRGGFKWVRGGSRAVIELRDEVKR